MSVLTCYSEILDPPMTNKAKNTLKCWVQHTCNIELHIQETVWSICNSETPHSYWPWKRIFTCRCTKNINICLGLVFNKFDGHFINQPFMLSTYHGQWWSILRTHCPQTEQWWALSGLTWEHSEQYRTSPWIDRIATGRSLLIANCSNVARGSTEDSIASISAFERANLKLKVHALKRWVYPRKDNDLESNNSGPGHIFYLLLWNTTRRRKNCIPVWPNE